MEIEIPYVGFLFPLAREPECPGREIIEALDALALGAFRRSCARTEEGVYLHVLALERGLADVAPRRLRAERGPGTKRPHESSPLGRSTTWHGAFRCKPRLGSIFTCPDVFPPYAAIPGKCRTLAALCGCRAEGMAVAREHVRGTDVILTTQGNRRTLCVSVKIMPGGVRELRLTRAVAHVASLVGRSAPPVASPELPVNASCRPRSEPFLV